MSEEDFVQSNAGIDDGKDIPRPILEELYHSVVNHEIVPVHEPDGIDDVYLMTDPDEEGWLSKAGGINNTSWRPRYFRICEGRLYYFEDDKATMEKGFFPLEDTYSAVAELSNHKNIEMTPLNGRIMPSLKVVNDPDEPDAIKYERGSHASLKLRAKTPDEARAWVRYLNAAAESERQKIKKEDMEKKAAEAAAADTVAAGSTGEVADTNQEM